MCGAAHCGPCNFKEMTNGLNLKEGESYLMLSVSKKGHNPDSGKTP